MMPPRRTGLTIIELMVTISIIALLVAAAGIGIARSRSSGRDAKRMSDVLLLSNALSTQAAATRGSYPAVVGSSTVGGINIPPLAGGAPLSPAISLSSFADHAYPSDPLPAKSSCSDDTERWLCGYAYFGRSTTSGSITVDSLARKNEQYEYVLAVGLENIASTDNQSLINVTDFDKSYLSGFYQTEITQYKRYQYLVLGPACGATLASNTCSQ
jgi:prepilin-type N-terminal cleavage/methylation domain-containing protein